MQLLFQPLVRGEVEDLRFQIVLCSDGPQLQDMIAVRGPRFERDGREIVEIRYGPDLGKTVAFFASRLLPSFSFWFDAKDGAYLGHRMPLHRKGPEVVLVRSGLTPKDLGVRVRPCGNSSLSTTVHRLATIAVEGAIRHRIRTQRRRICARLNSMDRRRYTTAVMSRMRKMISVLALAGLLAGRTGCASTSDMTQLKSDVATAQADAAEARRIAEEARDAAAAAQSDASAARAAADAAATEARTASEKADRIFQRSLHK